MKFNLVCIPKEDIADIITDNVLTGKWPIDPFERPFDENGEWRKEFTESGIKLIRKLFSLPSVKIVCMSGRSRVEVGIYTTYSFKEVLPEIRRVFEQI